MAELTPSPENAYHRVIHAAIASLAGEAGFATVEKAALETLTEFSVSYLRTLGQNTRNATEVAGRTKPTLPDVQFAMREMGFSEYSLLKSFARRPSRVVLTSPPQKEQPKTPVLLQVGEKMRLPEYIPEHFPPFPDPHNYVWTPSYKQPQGGYQSVREKAALQARDLERALTRFTGKTRETEILFNDDEEGLGHFIAATPYQLPYLEALIPKDQHYTLEDQPSDLGTALTGEASSSSKKQKGATKTTNKAKVEAMALEGFKAEKREERASKSGAHHSHRSGESKENIAESTAASTEDSNNQNTTTEEAEEKVDNPYLRPIKLPPIPMFGKRFTYSPVTMDISWSRRRTLGLGRAFPERRVSDYIYQRLGNMAESHYSMCLTPYVDQGCVNALAATRDGVLLASGSDDGNIYLWPLEQIFYRKDEKEDISYRIIEKVFAKSVSCLDFNCDGRLMASSSTSLAWVFVHDVKRKQMENCLELNSTSAGPQSVAFSKFDCNLLAVVGHGANIIDTRGRSVEMEFRNVHISPLENEIFLSVQFSPTEWYKMAVADVCKGLLLYDLRSLRHPYQTTEHLPQTLRRGIMSVRFHPNGRHLLLSRTQSCPLLYNSVNECLSLKADAPSYLNLITRKDCCFIGDHFIACGSDDFNIYLWKIPDSIDDPAQGMIVRTDCDVRLKGHQGTVNQVLYCDRFHTLFSSGVESNVRLWSPFSFPGSKPYEECYVERDADPFAPEGYLTDSIVLDGSEADSRQLLIYFDSMYRIQLEKLEHVLTLHKEPPVMCMSKLKKEIQALTGHRKIERMCQVLKESQERLHAASHEGHIELFEQGDGRHVPISSDEEEADLSETEDPSPVPQDMKPSASADQEVATRMAPIGLNDDDFQGPSETFSSRRSDARRQYRVRSFDEDDDE